MIILAKTPRYTFSEETGRHGIDLAMTAVPGGRPNQAPALKRETAWENGFIVNNYIFIQHPTVIIYNISASKFSSVLVSETAQLISGKIYKCCLYQLERVIDSRYSDK